MWQVIYVTSKEDAKVIKNRLVEQGFLVKLEAVDANSFQIKVPESEAEEVYDIINDLI
ncbi:MAG: hypothetical protein ACOCQO_02970 [Halanaerobiaceae bacterium]